MMKLPLKIVQFMVRLVYLIIGLFFHFMERAANWFIGYGKKTEYIKRGKCRKCGKCCKVLAIEYPRFLMPHRCTEKRGGRIIPPLAKGWWWDNGRLRVLELLIRWHEFRYGFAYLNREENYLLYKCNFLAVSPSLDERGQGAGARCRIYPFRPRLCREYPRLGLYGKPPTHLDCGYYFTRRDGKTTFDDVLRAGLSKGASSIPKT